MMLKNSNARKIQPKSYFAAMLLIIPLLIGIILFIGISDNRGIMALVLLVVPVLFAFYVLPLLKYSKSIKDYNHPNVIRLSFAIQILLSLSLLVSGFYILVLTRSLSNFIYWLFLISLGGIVLIDILRMAFDSHLIKGSNDKKTREGLIKSFLSLKPFIIVFLIVFISPYFESSSTFNLRYISIPQEMEAFKLWIEPKDFKEADTPIRDQQLITELFEQLQKQSVKNIRGISRSEYERTAKDNQPKYYLVPQYDQSNTGRKIQYIVILNNGFAAIEEFRSNTSLLKSDSVLYKIKLEESVIQNIISQINNNIGN
jgi:hypothetical protein